MTTGNFLYLLSEPFTRDAPLKFDREKTVVSCRKNKNGDVGPALEATGLAENGVGFLAWLAGSASRPAARRAESRFPHRIPSHSHLFS